MRVDDPLRSNTLRRQFRPAASHGEPATAAAITTAAPKSTDDSADKPHRHARQCAFAQRSGSVSMRPSTERYAGLYHDRTQTARFLRGTWGSPA